jgi:hypothetical protein
LTPPSGAWTWGAPWIWNLADGHSPEACQIVDRCHAKEHLSAVATTLDGPPTDLAPAWAHTRPTALEAGDLGALRRALQIPAPGTDAARTGAADIQRTRQRMRYPAFRAQGRCTSTGVGGAGCTLTIGTRRKRAGRHWPVAGAHAIIALRCAKLSGRCEDCWERRSQARAAG